MTQDLSTAHFNDFDEPYDPTPPRWLSPSLLFRAGWMGASVVGLGWRLTSTAGLWGGAIGAALGCITGARLAGSRLRLWVLAGLHLLTLLFLLGLAQGMVSWDWIVTILGSPYALAAGDLIAWGGGSFVVASFLRILAVRHPSFVVFELLLPLLALASVFSAHRQGNLHRPQDIADFALEKGESPVWYLVLIGVGCVVFLLLGLLKIRRSTQIVGATLLVVLLLSLFFWLFNRVHYADLISRLRMGSGDGQDSKDGKSGKGGKGGKGGKNKDEMDFQPPPQSNQQQPQPVAIVIFLDDYRPQSQIYYFRQEVLGFYNGVRMQKLHRAGMPKETLDFFPATNDKAPLTLPDGYQPPSPSPKAKPSENLSPLELLRRLSGESDLKAAFRKVETQISLMRTHRSPFGLTTPTLIQGLANPNPKVFVRSYAVQSIAWESRFNLSMELGNPAWPKELHDLYTQAPKDPRYENLAKEILAPHKSHPAIDKLIYKAYMVKRWLEKNGIYSLSFRTPASVKDHTAHFLFETRIGYCVHFSHAAIYLLRSLGIPARLAQGYMVSERSRGQTSSLLVRESDGHAWPEIYLRGVGWITFDIYPERTITPPPPPPDADLRRMMSNLARSDTPSPQEMQKQKDEKKLQKRSIVDLGAIPFGWLGLLLLLGLYGIKGYRRIAWRFADPTMLVFVYLRSLEDHLSELGLRRHRGEALETLAHRLAPKIPSFPAFADRLGARRFGSRLRMTPSDRTLVDRLRVEVAKARPLWRRLLGHLDPLSWFLHLPERWRDVPPPLWLRLLATREKLRGFFARLRSRLVPAKKTR